MSDVEVMTFESSDDAVAAMTDAGISAVASSPGIWSGAIKVPDDLPSLDAVILSEEASEEAKVLAGTLLALAPDRAVEGVFSFFVRAGDQASGATQNGE